MKINYQETTTDLQKRIDIHNQYGSKNIDHWMLQTLPLIPGNTILDVGCGSGKQCFSFYEYLHGQCNITGGDVSKEMIKEATEKAKSEEKNIRFIELDFNQPFPFEDNHFDIVSCCFAIYYANDIPFTIREMHRVLKQGGTLFTTGPMPDNKKIFYEIIHTATGLPIPPMPGSSRYSSEILNTIQATFSSVKVEIFENPLIFTTVDPFIQYTRASLSEDRKLWSNLFNDKDDFEKIIQKITAVADRYIEKDGKIIMTKVVGGFLGRK